MHNKLLINKTIIQPTWAYRLWGSTKWTNLDRIQSLQSKILRKIVDAPFYVTNLSIHNDLKVPFVHDLVRSRYKKFHQSTIHHPNPLVLSLSSNTLPLNPTRRLNRCWPRDLLVQWKANKLKWWVVQVITYDHNHILQLPLWSWFCTIKKKKKSIQYKSKASVWLLSLVLNRYKSSERYIGKMSPISLSSSFRKEDH
jgi:hypothetical protein